MRGLGWRGDSLAVVVVVVVWEGGPGVGVFVFPWEGTDGWMDGLCVGRGGVSGEDGLGCTF